MKETVSVWLERCLYLRQNVAAKTIVKGFRIITDRLKKEKERKEREEREKQEKARRERLEEERRQRDENEKKKTEEIEMTKFSVNFKSFKMLYHILI